MVRAPSVGSRLVTLLDMTELAALGVVVGVADLNR